MSSQDADDFDDDDCSFNIRESLYMSYDMNNSKAPSASRSAKGTASADKASGNATGKSAAMTSTSTSSSTGTRTSTSRKPVSFNGARMDIGDESESDMEDEDVSDDEDVGMEAVAEEEDESGSPSQSEGSARNSSGEVTNGQSHSPGSASRSMDSTAKSTASPLSTSPGTSPASRSRFGLAVAIMARAVRRSGDGTPNSAPSNSPPQRFFKSPSTTATTTTTPDATNASSRPQSAESSGSRPKLALRLQKFVATRLSDSSAGQLFMRGFLGPRGQAIVDTTGNIMVKHSGRATGGQMRRLMYKLASKFLVFEQNKLLTEEMRSAIREPMLILCYHIMNLLKMAKADPDLVCASQIAAIKVFIGDLYEALKRACSSILNAHNLDYLNAVFAYIMSEPFLEYCFQSGEIEAERDTVLTNLSLDYKEIESEILNINRCTSNRLLRRREILKNVLQRPSIRGLVRSAETATMITQWASKYANTSSSEERGGSNDITSADQQDGDARDSWMNEEGQAKKYEIDFKSVLSGLKFLIAAEYYATIVSRELAGTKALVIFDRFLGPLTATALVPVRQDILAEIGFQIDSEAYPQNLFERAREAEVQRLESMSILELFIRSREFRVLQFELDVVEKHLLAFRDLAESDGAFAVISGGRDSEASGLVSRSSIWSR